MTFRPLPPQAAKPPPTTASLSSFPPPTSSFPQNTLQQPSRDLSFQPSRDQLPSAANHLANSAKGTNEGPFRMNARKNSPLAASSALSRPQPQDSAGLSMGENRLNASALLQASVERLESKYRAENSISSLLAASGIPPTSILNASSHYTSPHHHTRTESNFNNSNTATRNDSSYPQPPISSASNPAFSRTDSTSPRFVQTPRKSSLFRSDHLGHAPPPPPTPPPTFSQQQQLSSHLHHTPPHTNASQFRQLHIIRQTNTPSHPVTSTGIALPRLEPSHSLPLPKHASTAPSAPFISPTVAGTSATKSVEASGEINDEANEEDASMRQPPPPTSILSNAAPHDIPSTVKISSAVSTESESPTRADKNTLERDPPNLPHAPIHHSNDNDMADNDSQHAINVKEESQAVAVGIKRSAGDKRLTDLKKLKSLRSATSLSNLSKQQRSKSPDDLSEAEK